MMFEALNNTDCEKLSLARNARFIIRHWRTPAHPAISDTPKAATNIESKAKAILNALNSISIKPGSSPSEIRALRKLCGNPFDFSDTPEIEVRKLNIPTDDGMLEAHMYCGSDTGEPSPCLVYYHGGGFVLGDLDAYDNMLKHLAKHAGIRIISVAYRLAPEHRFPIPVYDTLASFQWLLDNAASLNLDPHRFAIGGDSAGANLAAAACILMQEKALPQPLVQVLIYPCTIGNNSSPSRKKYARKLFLTKTAIEWFHSHYIDTKQEQDYRFNILGHTQLESLPPAFVLTAGFDPLRDEGWHYTQALKASGVEASHCCFTDVFHGFITYGLLPQAKAAVEECANLLNVVLKADTHRTDNCEEY